VTSVPDIRIPTDLLPSDGRFGCGPSKVRPEAVTALASEASTYLGTSHRQPRVKTVVGDLRAGLTELFTLPDGYEVVLGNGGSTLFWDAAAFGLVRRRSEHLVFGEFSSKFATVTKSAPFLDDPKVVESPTGTRPNVEIDADIDAYCLTQNETSTGVMMPLQRPAGVDAADALVLVDATSGAGGLRFDPNQVDAYYFAPQKSFASDGGIWFAALSPAAIERVHALAPTRWIPSSLSILEAYTNSLADQTLNTPALATLYLMREQVNWMNDNGGLGWAAARCDTSAEVIYSWAERSDYATPFVAQADERSHVVATIDIDARFDANMLAKILRSNGIVDTESYRKLGRNQLRVALFPAIEPDDVARLTRCIDHITAQLG
jgi:phosphoserine aminotransferase